MKTVVFIIIATLLYSIAGAGYISTRSEVISTTQKGLNFDAADMDTLLADTSVWNQFVNRAVYKVAVDMRCISAEYKIVTTPGTYAYNIDSLFLSENWMVKIENRTTVALIHWPVPALINRTDTTVGVFGAPKVFWVEGDSIHFFPTPTNEDTFLVAYSKYPTYLNYDTSSILIPKKFREAILFFTSYLFWSRVSEYDKANWWKSEYEALIERYRRDESNQTDIPKGP